MSENPRRGRQERNFTTNVPKILDLKSPSEEIFFRKLSLGAPDNLDMELNFIHAKCYKSMDTKCFTSDAVSGYLNAPDVTQYVVNCPYSLYLPH